MGCVGTRANTGQAEGLERSDDSLEQPSTVFENWGKKILKKINRPMEERAFGTRYMERTIRSAFVAQPTLSKISKRHSCGVQVPCALVHLRQTLQVPADSTARDLLAVQYCRGNSWWRRAWGQKKNVKQFHASMTLTGWPFEHFGLFSYFILCIVHVLYVKWTKKNQMKRINIDR